MEQYNFNEVVHATITRKLGGNRACGRVLCRGMYMYQTDYDSPSLP